MQMNKFTVQVNDLIGGWIITDYPHPYSEHDQRKKGNPEKFGHIIADCNSEKDAIRICRLLNKDDAENSEWVKGVLGTDMSK